jgi:hypothetical protein
MRRFPVAAVAAAFFVVACGGAGGPDLEFADWLFPVPDGTPVIEYAPVAIADRDPAAIRVVEDLVIGGDPDDEHTMFYNPTGILPLPSGEILVSEFGNKRVQMFSADGEFVKTIGRTGQGPGEFQAPFGLFAVGDGFGVIDLQNRRISFFSPVGDFLTDHPLGFSMFSNYVPTLADGSFVVLTNERDAQRNQSLGVTRYSPEGEPLARLFAMPGPPPPDPATAQDPTAQVQYMIDSAAWPRPDVAAAAEIVYASPGSEYQVLAMTPEGEPLWALRVAWPPPPYAAAQKELRIQAMSQRFPGIEVDDFTWPASEPAITSLRSDGAGRLYVFPNVSAAEVEGVEGRPVDVYSAEGELLVAGMITTSWMSSRGDHLYTFRGDPGLDQTVVVRYRLSIDER